MVRRGRNPDAHIHKNTSLEYWNNVDANDDGMLGGFPEQSRADLDGSMKFFTALQRTSLTDTSPKKPLPRAADCGAGIGRVTLGFLSKVASTIDVVEPVAKFTDEIQHGEPLRPVRESHQLGTVYSEGIDTWTPAPSSYDLIWIQWCCLYLNDTQLVACLRRCAPGLKAGGWVVVKENVVGEGSKGGRSSSGDVFDETDSSVTRTDGKFKSLFERAGLRVVRVETQGDWPEELYPVRMYGLQPEG